MLPSKNIKKVVAACACLCACVCVCLRVFACVCVCLRASASLCLGVRKETTRQASAQLTALSFFVKEVQTPAWIAVERKRRKLGNETWPLWCTGGKEQAPPRTASCRARFCCESQSAFSSEDVLSRMLCYVCVLCFVLCYLMRLCPILSSPHGPVVAVALSGLCLKGTRVL